MRASAMPPAGLTRRLAHRHSLLGAGFGCCSPSRHRAGHERSARGRGATREAAVDLGPVGTPDSRCSRAMRPIGNAGRDDAHSQRLARHNAERHGYADRAEIAVRTWRSRRRVGGLTSASAGPLLANPRSTPDRHRAFARLAPAAHVACTTRSKLGRAAERLSKPGGTFVRIHRPEAIDTVLASLAELWCHELTRSTRSLRPGDRDRARQECRRPPLQLLAGFPFSLTNGEGRPSTAPMRYWEHPASTLRGLSAVQSGLRRCAAGDQDSPFQDHILAARDRDLAAPASATPRRSRCHGERPAINCVFNRPASDGQRRVGEIPAGHHWKALWQSRTFLAAGRARG